MWGYEASLVVSGNDNPGELQGFPSLVVGMAPLHRPGHDPGENAIVALASVRQRDHPAGLLAGDRAYTNQKPENFQLPARALGYRLVLDYKSDQLGVQAEYRGMLQIEGEWYCPSIPEALKSATIDYVVNKSIDEATYLARLRERWHYRVLLKAGPDADGHVRMRCPATNPAPAVRCELKPRSERSATRGNTRVLVVRDVRDHPPAICAQQSLTVPPEAGAKFAQDLLYGSDEWHAHYATLRNSIKGMNGFVKDGAHEALDDPERRRVRGVAAQSVFIALLLMAANLRKIESFLAEEEAVAAGKVRTLPRRRRTRSIRTWRPENPVVGKMKEPDPPLTA